MERNEELTFEEAVTRLETIVSEMESGTLPLDECLRRFETAVSLSRACAARLEHAEKQIYLLTTADGPVPAAGVSWLESDARTEG